MEITREYFFERVGREPENDDLERSNCTCEGLAGHFMCGWCRVHDRPRFVCGCMQNDIVLTKSGVFEAVENPLFLETHVFRVDPSERPKATPNFGVLPLSYAGTVVLVYQEGVPQEMLEWLEKRADNIGDVYIGHMMRPQIFNNIFQQVESLLLAMVRSGKLFRGSDEKQWVFRP